MGLSLFSVWPALLKLPWMAGASFPALHPTKACGTGTGQEPAPRGTGVLMVGWADKCVMCQMVTVLVRKVQRLGGIRASGWREPRVPTLALRQGCGVGGEQEGRGGSQD